MTDMTRAIEGAKDGTVKRAETLLSYAVDGSASTGAVLYLAANDFNYAGMPERFLLTDDQVAALRKTYPKKFKEM